MGDYKDSVIEEQRHVLRRVENLCNERWETIQRLRKELDFMKGIRKEKEERMEQNETQGIIRQSLPKVDPKNPPIVSTVPGGARSELLDTGLTQIPHSAKKEIGKIFSEGALKYGRDNWKKGVYDKPYQRSRAEHAYNHFSEYLDNSSSDGSSPVQQLAKVAWFCVTQIDTLLREGAGEEIKKEIYQKEAAQGLYPTVPVE